MHHAIPFYKSITRHDGGMACCTRDLSVFVVDDGGTLMIMLMLMCFYWGSRSVVPLIRIQTVQYFYLLT